MKFLAAGLVVVLFVSCSDDSRPQRPVFNNDNNENNQNNTNNQNNSNNLADMGDMGDMTDMGGGDTGDDMGDDMSMTCPDVPCENGFECDNGTCIAVDTCRAPTDLGVLMDGGMLTANGNLATAGADVYTADCNADAGREQVFQFTLNEQLQVSYSADWIGQFDGLVDIRTDCADATTAAVCEDMEVGSVILEAGTYFLFAESRLGNPGEFAIELTGNVAACTPGVRTCNGDELQLCPDVNTIETFECGDTCVAGECDGKTCNAPITVVAPGGLYNGDAEGYQSMINFGANAACGSTATPGYEVVFYLPGLTTGDVVQIGTVGESAADPDVNVNAIFITEGACGQAEACVENFSGYESNQDFGDTVDWVVPSDGDYYITIDNLLAGGTPFRYKVEIIDI